MRALRQSQHLRKDFISFATASNLDSVNPDIQDDRIFNSVFRSNLQSQPCSQRVSSILNTINSKNHYSSAQIERMNNYYGKSQITNLLLNKKQDTNFSILAKTEKKYR